MHRWIGVLLLLTGISAGCNSPVNVEEERQTLLRLDSEWAASTGDLDKFLSYYSPDASVYAPGMPVATGTGSIREAFTQMTSTPGFSLTFTPNKAEVSASGDVGYTTGTYESSMNGVMDKG